MTIKNAGKAKQNKLDENTKATPEFVKKKLKELRMDGIPGDLIQDIKKKIECENLSNDQLEYFLNLVYINFNNSIAESSGPVGTVAAQSIGEPGTQMTLRTFHYAGIEEFSVIRGLPRFIEIVDARANPKFPQMTIFLNKSLRERTEDALSVLSHVEQVKVENLLYDVQIDNINWSVVLNFSLKMCKNKGIDINEILEILGKQKNIGSVKLEGHVITINPGVEDIHVLYKIREKVLKKVVKGIKGIKRATITLLKNKKEWIIKTEGSNLLAALEIEGVDTTRLFSNNVHEMEKIYGIEAARNHIIREAQSVLEQQDIIVDLRHLLVLGDAMCFSGSVQSIGRHGLSGSKSSVFARAGFEETASHLLDAGMYGEEERLLGIPENVIVGQICPIGTGKTKIIFDFDKNISILENREKNHIRNKKTHL